MEKMKENQLVKHSSDKTGALSIIYVSTFPPRKCGIATFTEDLSHAVDEILAPVVQFRIAAMNPNDVVSYRYPRRVILQINQDNQEDYIKAAQQINQMDEVPVVSIQHEFGIFGGEYGSHLISFLQALKKPAVITFHTVLPEPDEELYKTVRSLAESANAIVVMTTLSKKILTEQYAISQRKVKVIPHGIHSQPYSTSRQAKMTLGYSDRVVLSTFGLISRSKGLEYVIEALPQVVSKYPDFVYIIFGATHPVVLSQEGESYRNFLIERIYSLGLYDHVKLYNRYFPLNELLHFLKATDVYISPSLEPNQAVSGTLSYALGTGRPVISTAFAQAREVITDQVGIVVDFRDPQAYADAILQLLEDEEHRLNLGRNAYFRTRNMTWSNVALQYIKVFSERAPSLAKISDQKSLPRIKIDHLAHLTDNFGIVQFAKLTQRDVSSGYTLDDNARALVAAVLYYTKLGSAAQEPVVVREKRRLLKLINTYLGFISYVAQPDGNFHNYVKPDRTLDDGPNKEVSLEESNSRAIYALALTSTSASLPKSIRQKASDILQKRIKKRVDFHSPRAIARCIKALCILLDRKVPVGGIDLDETLRRQCNRMIRLYQTVSHTDWRWFENYLVYSNGIMPEALLLAYRTTKDERCLTVGKVTLDFLIEESFINGIFMPIGQDGWRHRDGKRYYYDQQSEEVNSIVYALNAGYMATGNTEYRRLMHQAFNWYLGDNSLGQVVYDRTTGGCYDGVGRKEVNLNQGAESTISYLLARLAVG